MHKHIIYISNHQYKDILSSHLAHAFAKYRYENGKTTFLVQKGINNNPLLLLSDADTIQIFLTNINIKQSSYLELKSKVQALINSLIEDGFNSQKCTIKLYTLESELANDVVVKKNTDNFNTKTIEDIATLFTVEIMNFFPYAQYSIEWHTIKQYFGDKTSGNFVNNIFNSNITFNKMILTGGYTENLDGKRYKNIKNYYPNYDLEKTH